MIKLSFKKQAKETGLSGVGNPYPATDIKVNKRICGYISPPNWTTKDNLWCIKFAVNTESSWGWRVSKRRFESEPEAREYLKNNLQILEKLDLFYFDD